MKVMKLMELPFMGSMASMKRLSAILARQF